MDNGSNKDMKRLLKQIKIPKLIGKLAISVGLLAGPGLACVFAFDYPMRVEKVSERVFALITPSRELPNPENGGWNSNMAFVVAKDGVLLFDSGSSEAIGLAAKNAIRSITDKPVRWIVNSHAHGDHWLGNAAFSDTVETIIASAPVAELIANDGARWVALFNDMTGGITQRSEIKTPNKIINKDDILSISNLNVELILSGGGHSPGDLMAWLPEERVLLSGDVIYSDRMPSTNAGDLARWLEILPRLEALDPIAVVPGHGSVTDKEGITQLLSLLNALWQSVEEGIEKGLSDFEMLPTVSKALEPFKSRYPGLEEKLRRDLSHVYLQIEATTF